MGVLTTIVIAFVSAALGAGSKLFVDALAQERERKTVATILAAEISATIAIIEQRRYVAVSQAFLAQLKSGSDVNLPDYVLNPEKLDEAYRGSLTTMRLGLLGPELACLVTKFYRQLHGLISDVKRFGDPSMQFPIAEKVSMLEQNLDIWASARGDGLEAVKRLSDSAKQKSFLTSRFL